VKFRNPVCFDLMVASFVCGALALGAVMALPTPAWAFAPSPVGDEFGFSPEGSAKALVLKVVDASTRSLDIMAYGFTSQEVTTAVIEAARRGVAVRVVVDYKANVSDDRSGAAQRALTRLVKAGVQVRTVNAYAIHHDKVMIADGKHVQGGSFNYSAAAASKNSENVFVRWSNPQAGAAYGQHFTSRWVQGVEFKGVK
jgi:phosphatidylserine/phosphatidylglycerophosphate/cardiolipin synthase-like enzyme